jgi:hypothetical protein
MILQGELACAPLFVSGASARGAARRSRPFSRAASFGGRPGLSPDGGRGCSLVTFPPQRPQNRE